MTDKLLPGAHVTRMDPGQREIIAGDWYWVRFTADEKDKDAEGKIRRLACVTHVGSNYAELKTAGEETYTLRLHFDTFDAQAEHAPDAAEVVRREVNQRHHHTALLMERVKELTAQLALTAGQGSVNETEALTLSTGARPAQEYKAALVKANEETLPALFKEIKAVQKAAAAWMQAELLPMEAQIAAMEPAQELIKKRIFSVELYAGLVEEVELIKDGTPADIDTPIHLYQRRAYMDEECLARYTAGGMEFKDLRAFDRWFAQPGNVSRLIPHPRGILAMQVRRREKVRDVSLREFIRIELEGLREQDKLTFLYIRNGERIYRLSTGIDFGPRLFGDAADLDLTQPMYGKVSRYSDHKIEGLITEGHLTEMRRAQKAAEAAFKVKHDEWKRITKKLKAQGKKFSDPEWPSEPWRDWSRDDHQYHKFSPESVYYDDISKYVAQQVDEHNRLVLVLQGLLDRSEVLAPHPPYRLWDPLDFNRAFMLVYDDSRALVPGEAIDFEVYREQINKHLAIGSVTIGQEDYWMEIEATKENERQARDWRVRDKSNYKRYKPYGDPGPGMLAKVTALSKTKGASYRWERKRQRYSKWDSQSATLPRTITVPVSRLFNVDAYTPGDYQLFFNDPRTRAEYLQWAPFLLVAEDYHAGRRKLGEHFGETVRASW